MSNTIITIKRPSIKIARAKKYAKQLPKAEDVTWADISQSLQANLTAAQLAEVVASMTRHWHRAVRWAEAEACANGCIFDAKKEILMDIVEPAKKVFEPSRLTCTHQALVDAQKRT